MFAVFASVRRRGSSLLAVLWSLIILSTVAFSALESVRLELRAVKNHTDAQQAFYLALAGVEKAKALIWHRVRDAQRQAAVHPASLLDDPNACRDQRLGRGLFRIVRQAGDAEGGGTVYGIEDECGRLNVNSAPLVELARLPGATAQAAAAIADWRDEDHTVTPAGAEQEEYALLAPPYRMRNGPLETLDEILMVRGIDPADLDGEDADRDGRLDPNEDDGAGSPPTDNADGRLERGWRGMVTLESSAPNVNARGKRRVNVANADAAALEALPGFSAELAGAVVRARGERPIENLAHLLKLTAPARQGGASGADGAPAAAPEQTGRSPPALEAGTPPPAAPPVATPASGSPADATAPGGGPGGGETLISEALFKDIADEVAVTDEPETPGLVNINTAAADVLACVNGLNRDLASAIVARRLGSGPYRSVAALLDVAGMTREIFEQTCPRLCVRSSVYRVVAEGLVPTTGARRRIEVVVAMDGSRVTTLSFAEGF